MAADLPVLIRLASSLPTGSDERHAVLSLIAGCEKLPAGPMRENCEKKKKEGEENDEKDAKKANAYGMEPERLYKLKNKDWFFYALEAQKNGSMKGYQVVWEPSDFNPSKAVTSRVDTTWARDWKEIQKSDLDPKVVKRFAARVRLAHPKSTVTLLRIASSLPVGNESRREILSGLRSAAFGVVELEVESMENASKPYWVTGIGLSKYAVNERGISGALKDLVEERVRREASALGRGPNPASVEAVAPPVSVVRAATSKADDAGKAYVLYNTKSDRWAVK